MKNISWLNLLGGLFALTLAVVHIGGMAFLIGATPLYIIVGIGLGLMLWDLIVTARDTAEKRSNQ